MSGGAPPAAATAALRRCIGDPDRFAGESWGRRPLLRRAGDGVGFADLLSLDDVDHLIASVGLRLPAFRLVRDGAVLPASSYTKTTRTGSQSASGVADAAAIFAQFDAGATVVLQGMHRYWQPLARFCRLLELALGHPVQANAYLTPPGSQGFDVHEDTHDVFVLQVHGGKEWRVYERGDMPPTREPLVGTEIRPGDSLYIPGAFPHAAATQRTASLHVTVGILSVTWMAALREVMKLAEREPAFAEPLPLRFAEDPAGFADLVSGRLAELGEWVAKSDAAEVGGRLRRGFLTGRQPILPGQLTQVLGLDESDDDTVVRRRDTTFCHVERVGEELSVLLGDRELRLPAWTEPALRAVTAPGGIAVGDLTPYLDAAGRQVLVRRLVREGLLEVVG